MSIKSRSTDLNRHFVQGTSDGGLVCKDEKGMVNEHEIYNKKA